MNLEKSAKGTRAQSCVKDGTDGFSNHDENHICEAARSEVIESMGLDACFKTLYPQQGRWDYLVAFGPKRNPDIEALEVHPCVDLNEVARCQIASNIDPLFASKFDPPINAIFA